MKILYGLESIRRSLYV